MLIILVCSCQGRYDNSCGPLVAVGGTMITVVGHTGLKVVRREDPAIASAVGRYDRLYMLNVCTHPVGSETSQKNPYQGARCLTTSIAHIDGASTKET